MASHGRQIGGSVHGAFGLRPAGQEQLGIAVEHGSDHAGTTRPANAWRARRHLVDDGAERKDVGPRIDRSSFELLRSHVLERAEDRALLGQRLVAFARRGGVGIEGGRGRAKRGYPEIEQLRACSRQHDVCGLQIPVDDTLPVSMVEGAGNLDGEAQDLIDRQWTSEQAMGERFAIEILHHDELDVVLLADVVEARRCEDG